jgi:hypothetical protein
LRDVFEVIFLLEVAPADTATREADGLNEAEGIAEKGRCFVADPARDWAKECVKGTLRAN